MSGPVKRTAEGYGYNSDFPERLRALMENRNNISPLKRTVTQAELARHLGVTRQAVSAYTLGASIPDMLKFKEIADFFKVNYAWLLGASILMIEDHSNFAEKAGLGARTINAILRICKVPEYAFSFMCLVETMEFEEILNAIWAYLSIHWTKQISKDDLVRIDAKVRKETGGALRAVPATLEKNMLIMNAQTYLSEAIKAIDKKTRPPEGSASEVTWDRPVEEK